MITSSIWSPAMSTGLKPMDDLHRDLLDMLARLPELEDERFEQAYAVFVQKVEHAFANEEIWMEDIGFPALKSHLEQHARVLSALHRVHARIMQGDFSEGRHVVKDLLPQWFCFHITTMDTALGMSVQMVKARSPKAKRALEYVD